jgi:multiple sugar transport system substrate-binding protein
MHHSKHRVSFGLRPLRWLSAALALALLLAACSSGGSNRDAESEPTTIKVMYWNDQMFQTEFGMLFYALHPNIEVEVVNTSAIQTGGDGGDYEEKLDEFIRNEKPDILLLSQEQYAKYAADGRLASLESYVTRDKFDLEGLIPGMADLMREKGGGELYGLSPRFSSQAIYYNKDLFDRYNISYPTDRMSWEEVLNLAARFAGDDSDEDRIYGLHFANADAHQLAQQIGLTQGLRVVNPADKRVTIDSESWVRVYETALNAVRSGVLYQDGPPDFSGIMSYEEFLLRDPFIAGKVAMSIGESYRLLQLREAVNVIPDKVVKNWDLVTMPVDPANPDFSYGIYFYEIFAINAESANRDAAWEFIRYIHSDEYARVKSKSLTSDFLVRTKYIRDDEGRNLEAFWSLKPLGANQYDLYRDLPGIFHMQLNSIGSEEMQAVLNDEKTVHEALASMQTRLQAALDQALANEERNGDAEAEQGSAGVSIETGVSVDEAEPEAAGDGAAE